MRVFLKSAATVLGGVALGVVVTWFTLMRGAGMGGDVSDGPWRTSLLIGSNQSGMMLRAMVALHGLLALNRSETVYYTATADSAGAKLSGTACYAIEGRDPPAQWWSITAYGADDFLIPNKENRYAVSKNAVIRGDDGAFTITASGRAKGANTLATGERTFSLTLRLYNPDPRVVADPAHAALPSIRAVACR